VTAPAVLFIVSYTQLVLLKLKCLLVSTTRAIGPTYIPTYSNPQPSHRTANKPIIPPG